MRWTGGSSGSSLSNVANEAVSAYTGIAPVLADFEEMLGMALIAASSWLQGFYFL